MGSVRLSAHAEVLPALVMQIKSKLAYLTTIGNAYGELEQALLPSGKSFASTHLVADLLYSSDI